jgi:hypothetical protein
MVLLITTSLQKASIIQEIYFGMTSAHQMMMYLTNNLILRRTEI